MTLLHREDTNKLDVEVTYISEDTQLTLADTCVRADLSGGDVVATLPSVADAKGMFFSFVIRTVGDDGGGPPATPYTLTVADKDDSEAWTDLEFDGQSESNYVGKLLYSDGIKWWVTGADEVVLQ